MKWLIIQLNSRSANGRQKTHWCTKMLSFENWPTALIKEMLHNSILTFASPLRIYLQRFLLIFSDSPVDHAMFRNQILELNTSYSLTQSPDWMKGDNGSVVLGWWIRPLALDWSCSEQRYMWYLTYIILSHRLCKGCRHVIKKNMKKYVTKLILL